MRCIVCDSEKNKKIFNEFNIDVLKCLNCGHIFSSYASSQNYDGYYGYGNLSDEEMFWWNEAHLAMYNDFCNKFIIGKRGTLLDVGCGLGYFVKKASSYSGWKVVGYEISQNAVNYANNKLGLKNVFYGRVEASGFREKNFNLITLWDVIEHIPNPDPILRYLNTILSDDGFIFLHTPNIKIQLFKARLKFLFKGIKEGAHYLEAKDHLNIYSPRTISAVLKRNGFNSIKFIHLRPIQSVSGSKSMFLKIIKNLWFWGATCLFKITLGKINIDNLFIIARKTKI